MTEINAWEVREEDDGGSPRHLCYAANERTAKAIGARPENFIPRGPGGQPPPMVRPTTIVIVDTLEEFDDYKRDEIKRGALARLTPAERKALGY